ncbi:phosphonoacetaldehyde reductase [Lysinibacillus sp. NPDC093210]|uniref:phosphonoacetaldehyde reductase n=1 Tax=Lysinibacillus sp. NPDC093210 TaxID=3364133 RepID=UPI00380D6E04
MSKYNNPVKVEFGRGSIDFLPRFINGRKALLVTSKGFVTRGLVNQIVNNNTEIVNIIDTIQPNPTLNQLEEIRKNIQYEEFEIIVALGGGSVIDAAKAIAPYKSEAQLDLLDLLTNGLSSRVLVKPIIAIPTTAGTGSEVTMWGTVWEDVKKKKYSISDNRLYCEAAILDPELHLTVPRNITLQTGLDALSHSLESIWNRNNNKVSSIYAVKSACMVLEVLPNLVEDLANIELRERMLLASYYAGVAFSNTQTSIAHAMSYYMTLNKDIPHGIATSITLPIIIDTYLKQDLNNKHPFITEQLKQRIVKLFKQLKQDLLITDYGLTKQDFDNIFSELNTNVRAQNSIINSTELYDNILIQLESR